MIIFYSRFKKLFLLFLFFSIISFAYVLSQIPDNKFHIYFLDVGQGDSIFIKTPYNHKILIDGGPSGVVSDRLSDIMPFFDSSIDLLILTHPHSDHINGLVEAINRYDIETILITGVLSDEFAYLEFLQKIISFNIPVIFADRKKDLLFGDALLDVIHPVSPIIENSFENLNNSSIVIKVVYGRHSILLTGDCEYDCEAELLKADVSLDSDILKVGHHGSKTSSSMEFLSRVLPETAVIQSGSDNKWGHPHPETLENLRSSGVDEIYRNDLDGMIEFVF